MHPPHRRHAAARGRRGCSEIQQMRVQAAGAALPCVPRKGHLRAGAPRERAAQLAASSGRVLPPRHPAPPPAPFVRSWGRCAAGARAGTPASKTFSAPAAPGVRHGCKRKGPCDFAPSEAAPRAGTSGTAAGPTAPPAAGHVCAGLWRSPPAPGGAGAAAAHLTPLHQLQRRRSAASATENAFCAAEMLQPPRLRLREARGAPQEAWQARHHHRRSPQASPRAPTPVRPSRPAWRQSGQ